MFHFYKEAFELGNGNLLCTLRNIAAFSYLPKVRLSGVSVCTAKVFWASINREIMQQRPSFEVFRYATFTGRGCKLSLKHGELRNYWGFLWLDPNGKFFLASTTIVKRQLTNAPDDSAVFSCFWQDKFTCQFSQFTSLLPVPFFRKLQCHAELIWRKIKAQKTFLTYHATDTPNIYFWKIRNSCNVGLECKILKSYLN